MSRILLPTAENLALAAAAIREGKLVGLPTETVYGIAADAFNEEAVRATFEAKGRPPENPLIVHLADLSELERVASFVPVAAYLLAAQFWPGPLTIVVPKQPQLPAVTTGGLDTVAVRVPKHPVARKLIRLAGTPLSAPSANPFMGLSPTRADHIEGNLASQLELILDGGPCDVGVESTVVDTIVEGRVRILRAGAVSQADIERILAGTGFIVEAAGSSTGEPRRSPGLYVRHYAPRTPLRIVERLGPEDAGLVLHPPLNPNQIELPRRAKPYAANLYATLHDLDRRGLGEILVQSPPETGPWAAVWDRLRRATGKMH